MIAILAVAKNTLREAIRDKVLYVILFFGVLGMALSGVLADVAVSQNVRLVRDLGLAGSNLLLVFVAIFLGVTLLYKEIDRRTIVAILSKPIDRWQFMVGKFLGMAATVLLLSLLLAGVLELLLWRQQSSLDGTMARVLALSAMEILVVTALAIFFSSWTSPFLSGLFTLGLFVLGRAAEDLSAIAMKSTGAVAPILKLAHRIIPNLNLFHVSGYEVDARHVSIHGAFIDWTYVLHAGVYAALYVLGTVALAVLLFRKRDFV